MPVQAPLPAISSVCALSTRAAVPSINSPAPDITRVTPPPDESCPAIQRMPLITLKVPLPPLRPLSSTRESVDPALPW